MNPAGRNEHEENHRKKDVAEYLHKPHNNARLAFYKLYKLSMGRKAHKMNLLRNPFAGLYLRQI